MFVWLYLFDEAKLEVAAASGAGSGQPVHLWHALALLPAIRACYAPPDELGHDFFKLQCYFVTHALYVCSDWGAQALSRHLFAEELAFLLRFMPAALRLRDPEIVAEFVHCLRLFGVPAPGLDDAPPLNGHHHEGGAAAPALFACGEVLGLGVDFLVRWEADKGRGEGRWPSRYGDSLYNRYHAAFVGSQALGRVPMSRAPLHVGPPPPRGVLCPLPAAALAAAAGSATRSGRRTEAPPCRAATSESAAEPAAEPAAELTAEPMVEPMAELTVEPSVAVAEPAVAEPAAAEPAAVEVGSGAVAGAKAHEDQHGKRADSQANLTALHAPVEAEASQWAASETTAKAVAEAIDEDMAEPVAEPVAQSTRYATGDDNNDAFDAADEAVEESGSSPEENDDEVLLMAD